MLAHPVICCCHSAAGGLVSKLVVSICGMPELISYWGFDLTAWSLFFQYKCKRSLNYVISG